MKLLCLLCKSSIFYTTKSAFTRAKTSERRACKCCVKKRWLQEHPEIRSAAQKRWNDKNKSYHTRYWLKNKNHIRARFSRWVTANWEEYYAKKRQASSLRRARYKQTDITEAYLRRWLKRSVRCKLCKKRMNTVYMHPLSKTIDHIKPLCQGGRHLKKNIRIVCRRCNGRRPRWQS